MQNHPVLTMALLAAASLTFGGCAAGLGGDDYSRTEARQTMHIRFATVESVRPVKLEGTKTPIGTAAGAVAGGVIGSSLGRGHTSSSVGAVLGAIAGGVGGAAVEEAVTRQDGVEITVRLENGEYLAIVQADKGENFRRGERVRLVGSGQATRVTRDASAQD
ncbi:MAG: glycine zipper 2TM domain-containing protein [Azoarcus sp.]|nr:glycine zipper 2TM domain-containing protein [Azoarcus sp.]